MIPEAPKNEYKHRLNNEDLNKYTQFGVSMLTKGSSAFDEGVLADRSTVIKWLWEPCTEHNKSGYVTGGYLEDKKVFYEELLHKDCPVCMELFKGE